ncbi:MAG: N-acetylmuramoyl-L-alanine amidase [Rhodobacteraceae bacterium]|nr:N-acetylmuramoyl-L-alanine amidase [Paracoccaceae bacterium]
MVDAEAALQRLCDPEIEVSAHYLIARDGTLFRLVDEEMRAWHAGAGAWGAVTDVNSRSVGIELDNTGAQPFAEPQMAALEALLPGIMHRWSIPPERVIAHSDMAPTRKYDPGGKFDWRRLALQGLSVWPGLSSAPAGPSLSGKGPQGADERAFQAAARGFGYPEAGVDALLAGFRSRFRPCVEGPLQDADTALLQQLASRYPVDRGVAGT